MYTARHTRKVIVGFLVAVTTLVCTSTPSRAEVSGFQDFVVVNRSATEGRVTAIGVLTSTGTVAVPEGQRPTPFPVIMTFDEGSLFLTIEPSHDSSRFDARSCVLSGPIFGTYQVTGGTGELEGASGTGTFEGYVVNVFARDSEGKCLGPASGQPPIARDPVRPEPGHHQPSRLRDVTMAELARGGLIRPTSASSSPLTVGCREAGRLPAAAERYPAEHWAHDGSGSPLSHRVPSPLKPRLSALF